MAQGRNALIAEVARVLEEVVGVSLAGGLDRALETGLGEAASALGEDPAALARRVSAREPDAVAALVDHALVGETAFWRHPAQLAAVGRLAARASGPLSIWCAGCATGEEAYSVAMALLEAGRGGRVDRILGTDLSERALAAAREGVYGRRALRRLPDDVARRWMEGAGEERRVCAAARASVSFARHNLAAEPAPAARPFDLVLCRNVLIYFEPRTAAAVLYGLADALRPGGALVLGPVELPLARALSLDWVVDGDATLLVRPR
ncbi:MAG TPA: CheR family methyltransferase [Anaeromyxobacter sp.]